MSTSEPFKRKRLPGSEELFRDTRSEAVGPNPPPVPPADQIAVALDPEEVRWIVDAIQMARFPEMQRARPTMTRYEQLGALQDRLRRLLEPPEDS